MISKLDNAFMRAVRELRSDSEEFKHFERNAMAIHSKADRMLRGLSKTLEEFNLKVTFLELALDLEGNIGLTLKCEGNGIFSNMSKALTLRCIKDFEAQALKHVHKCRIDPTASRDEDPKYFGHIIYDAHIFIEG